MLGKAEFEIAMLFLSFFVVVIVHCSNCLLCLLHWKASSILPLTTIQLASSPMLPFSKQLNRIRQILQIVLMLWTLPRSLDQEGNLMGYSQFKESWLTANIFINVYRWMVVGKGVCLHNVVLIMFSIQRSQCNLQRNLSDVFHFSWSKEQTWSNFSRACSNWWKSSAVGCQICFP